MFGIEPGCLSGRRRLVSAGSGGRRDDQGEGQTVTLDADMRRVVDEQRLSFVATVNPDGTPNLSPKGSIRVWDDHHLVFGDIRSPNTVRNLEINRTTEINIVDPISRRGYRFRGTAEILRSGANYDRVLAFLKESGVSSAVGAIVLVRVEKASPVVSPAYDSGASEEEIRATWLKRRASHNAQ